MSDVKTSPFFTLANKTTTFGELLGVGDKLISISGVAPTSRIMTDHSKTLLELGQATVTVSQLPSYFGLTINLVSHA